MSKSKMILEEIAKLSQKMEQFEKILETLVEKIDKLETKKTKKTEKTLKIKKKKEKKIIKLGNVLLTKYDDILLVTGDTYARKAILKKYKARWKPEKKGWTLNLNYYEDIKEDLQTYCENVEIVEKNQSLVEKQEDTVSTESVDNQMVVNNICEIMSDDE